MKNVAVTFVISGVALATVGAFRDGSTASVWAAVGAWSALGVGALLRSWERS